MKSKSVKTAPPRGGKKNAAKVESSQPSKPAPAKQAPAAKREGPDNLRQRAEWFRRRTGGSDAQ
jgi:hypothetical protein